MKRFLLLAAALGTVVFFARVEPSGQNIGSLQPVQVLVVSAGGDIRLKSDTGDEGFGDSVASALEKMGASASGEVFLDTADYLLISDAALLAEIEPYLRPSCRVCLFEGEPDLEKLGEYLKHHDPGVSLKDCTAEQVDLPILRIEEGRMELAF